jgi:hypothetical protein
VTLTTFADYKKARAEGGPLPIPARSALRLAQYHAEAPDWHGLTPTGDGIGSRKSVASGVIDGFTVAVAVVQDEYPEIADLLGTFTRSTDRYGERIPRPDPSAILWNNGGTWALERGEHWYTPIESLAEIMAYYHDNGAARGVAREMALADIKRRAHGDADELDRGQYHVDVRASRAGVELGRSSVGGFAPSDEDWQREIGDLLPDQIAEAIDEARATLARLCEAEA